MAKKSKTDHWDEGQTNLYHLGSGYVTGSDFTKKELAKLYKTWNKRLKRSGLVDIERNNPDNGGFYSPFFYPDKNYKSSHHHSTDAGEEINLFKREYFRLVSIYVECADFSVLFKDKPKLWIRQAKWLLQLHADGMTYRDMHRALKSKSVKHNTKFRKIAFTTMFLIVKEALEPMMDWHKTNPDGAYYKSDDPADVLYED